MTKTITSEPAILDTLREMIGRRGADLYGDEAVTQAQHALQCAQLAEDEGADAALIVAALLHDVGHLLEADYGSDLARQEDRYHENLGKAFLDKAFPPNVTEPVRLHVAAKRYLCAVDKAYRSTLSPASENSLQLQGGPMSDAEVAAFEALPFYAEAVRLRKWDDRGKDPQMQTGALEHFLSYVAECAR